MPRYLLAVVAIAASVLPARAGFIHDAAGDFSATNNPTGPWRYGYTATLGSAFNLYPTAAISGAINYWYDPAVPDPIGGTPGVFHNPTGGTVVQGTVSWLPGQLIFHPGVQGQYSVVRFIVPETATLTLSSAFTGRDVAVPTSTDVHVLHNGASLFAGNVTAFGVGPSYSSNFAVNAGDILDFAVGFGNGNYFSDSTSIDVHLVGVTGPNAVPEPGSLALVAVGVAGAAAYRASRRRKG